MLDYVRAHRKALLAALTGVLILFVDAETADEVIGAVGIVLTWLVPNDQQAVQRLYH